MTTNPIAKASDSFKRLNPQLFNETRPQGIRHAVAQQDAVSEPLATHRDEARSPKRYQVGIERCGIRLLDKDNLYGSAKYVCDGLRHYGLIPDDDPDSIDLQVTQKKVPRDQVATVVTIERIL